MRIKELSIAHYGPLPETGRLAPGNFALIRADNEQGKTLTVEAVARMLLGPHASAIRGIHRVAEDCPEGFVILETVDGEVRKLPADGSLVDFCTLSAEQWRNIFLIRDSDLSIENDGKVYTSVADRLTGLKTKDIGATIEALLELGRITPTGRISNTQDDNHLKDRVEEAQALLRRVEELQERCEQEGLGALEKHLLEVDERIAQVDEELQSRELARKREAYRKSAEALRQVRDALRALEDMAEFTEDEADRWRELEQEARRHGRRIEELQQEAAKLEKRSLALRDNRDARQQELDRLEARKSDAAELPVRIDRYRQEAERVQSGRPTAAFARRAVWLSGALAALALCTLLFTDSAFLVGLSVLMLICTGGVGVALWRQASAEGRLQADLAAILQQAAGLGLQASSAAEVAAGLRKLEEEARAARQSIEQNEARREAAEERLEQIKKREIPAAKEAQEDAERQIDRLARKRDVQNLAEYRKRLAAKQQVRQEANSAAAVLTSRFDRPHQDLAGNLRFWEGELEQLAQFADAAPGVEYEVAQVHRLQQERDELDHRRADRRAELQSLRENLAGIERTVNGLLPQGHDFVHCDTTGDLAAVRSHTSEFVENCLDTAECAHQAIGIFRQIDREEQEKVAGLFGPDSPASRYFTQITEGLYEAVLYRQDGGEGPHVCVQAADGTVLQATALSGGAYDQLYLAIRLALGEALMAGEPGFFLLDDPFVKADPTRLRRQLGVLKRIAAQGWQVLYFTAKGEVEDALADDLAAGSVSQLRLPDMHA